MNILVAAILAALTLMLALAAFTWWTASRVRAALPPQGRFVDAGGIRFHVSEEGSGPALLLIHGLAGQMRHYTYGVARRLAADYRVVAIDRPGSGYSVRGEETPADLSTQAGAIAALIDTLGLGRPLVVGHSLGGAIALTLALEHPGQVGGLALIAPLTHLPEGEQPPAAFRALTIATPWLRKLFAWTLAVPGAIAGRRKVLDQVFGPDPVPRDFGTRGGGLLSLMPSQFIAASRDLQAVPARLPAIVSRYAELRVPVGVLFGRQDRILDWKINGEALAARVPGARLELVDGGHMLPVIHPERTASFIRDCAARV
ncbi:alpha/beta fold hydrolase [Noviherbaspirillum aridicola]|uniref:Alpha/beta hydrolase n=1 Tax=Noviherbaspirillum aridicola TaxID=2849687 RepID=A0ABQ4Q8P7_9BURK|nr:alpha/beta fold hydrolase [Noviherbaspirillum aridicola]GIZ53361.1 alpha/beta hydrolase [Noviherbaspirillum aridicola]